MTTLEVLPSARVAKRALYQGLAAAAGQPITAVWPDDQFRTPDALVAAVKRALQIDQFTLDLCASPDNATAGIWFGLQRDGAFIDAFGMPMVTGPAEDVWCNPPYSDIGPWVDLSVSLLQARRAASVTLLVPGDHSTAWYRRGFAASSRVLQLWPRVSFELPGGVSPQGQQLSGARFPSTVLHLTPRPPVFPLVTLFDWKQAAV